MKKYISYIFVLMAAVFFAACQDKDLPGDGTPVIAAPDASQFQGQLNGYDYTISWPQPAAGRSIGLTLYKSGAQTVIDESCLTATSYTLKNVDTNVEYWFVFRESDGTNQSLGTIIKYSRPGATKIQNLTLKQVESVNNTNNLIISWDASADAETYELVATNGTVTKQETIAAGTTTSYAIRNVVYGDTWNVSVTAANSKGKAIPETGSLLIGKTHLAFISDYATPDNLVANGDDDEASAWLWFKANYPNAEFLQFSKITSAEVLEPYRMLFFMRDFDDNDAADKVKNGFSAAQMAAASIIGAWVKNGGNMLLWQFATPYIFKIGRLDETTLMTDCAIDTGKGGINNDIWNMAVGVATSEFSKDFGSHALYKGITFNVTSGGINEVPCKGGGWTENHNCIFKGIPATLTGKSATSKACYNSLTTEYGIYPLGTWNDYGGVANQINHLNVWEATKGSKTDYKGTILCIGNGGCEFSMKNTDGSNDISAQPKNNSYQENILKMAKNAVDYLMSK